MARRVQTKAFYDPLKTYESNFKDGPFKVFADETDYKNSGQPKYSFLGKKVYSPFGIPAGPLLNSQHVIYALKRGFDVVVYKTQRTGVFKVNKFPQVLYVDTDGDLTLKKAAKPLQGTTTTGKPYTQISITNSFGMPSKGPQFWVDDLKEAIKAQGKGQLIVASVVGTIKEGFSKEDYFDDFAAAAKLAADAGAEAVEVNLSCPNVANEGVICYTLDAVAAICSKVKAKIGDVPMIIKVGYYSKDQQAVLDQIVKEVGPILAGISAINTIPAPVVDKNGDQALPGPNRLMSGICGAGIKWAGLDMVERLASLRKKHGMDFEIIGVGGVMTPKDFHEYRQVGADVVQSATGAMWNPKLAAEVKATL